MAKAYNILPRTLLKRGYCSCCGSALQRKSVDKVVDSFDEEYTKFGMFALDKPNYYDVRSIEYYCPTCKKIIPAKYQFEVDLAQKRYRRKKVSKDEVYKTKIKQDKKSINTLTGLTFLLTIPVVGVAACVFYTLQGRPRQYARDDVIKMVFPAPIITFFVSLIIFMFTLPFLPLPDSFYTYQKEILFLLSSWASGIPVIWFVSQIKKEFQTIYKQYQKNI